MSTTVTTRQTYFRPRVSAKTWLTPGMIRITLSDPSLCSFPGTGIGDEYVRVHFPFPDGELPTPAVDAEGNWTYAPGRYPPVAPYTLRRHDAAAGEIDIDFVMHERGVATEWARGVDVGGEVAFGEPRGLFAPPSGATDLVFLTDATGLPALARLLEQLSPGTRARCIVEVAEESHRQVLSSPARLGVEWLVGSGNGTGVPSGLTAAVARLDLAPGSYLWVAGEAGELKATRRHLKRERGYDPEGHKVIGYWIDEAAE